MNAEWVPLEQLDRLDRELARIQQELARLAARLQAQEAAVLERGAAREQARAAFDANKAAERTENRQIEDLSNSRKAALRVLETGAGNPEAAQRQLDRCNALIDEAETRVLELMERQDTLRTALAEAEAALAQSEEGLRIERATQPGRIAELEGERAERAAERVEAAKAVPSELRQRYEAFRERGRWAVARIRGNACEACSMAVQPQMVAEVRRGRLVACHGCHRWLVE